MRAQLIGSFPATALLASVLAVGACSPVDGGGLLVFAAASLEESLLEVGQAFEEETAVSPTFNFAGTNVLAAQIEATTAGDLFVSADSEWMDRVEGLGRLVTGSRREVLGNRLVVIAHAASPIRLASAAELATADYRFLALADPDVVPAGRYARRSLESASLGSESLWARVEGRVATAADVRAALALVEIGPEILGIVYRTDAAISKRVRVILEIPDQLTPPIRYEAAALAGSAAPERARRFLDFLAGAAAGSIFEKHGFLALPDSGRAPADAEGTQGQAAPTPRARTRRR